MKPMTRDHPDISSGCYGNDIVTILPLGKQEKGELYARVQVGNGAMQLQRIYSATWVGIAIFK